MTKFDVMYYWEGFFLKGYWEVDNDMLTIIFLISMLQVLSDPLAGGTYL